MAVVPLRIVAIIAVLLVIAWPVATSWIFCFLASLRNPGALGEFQFPYMQWVEVAIEADFAKMDWIAKGWFIIAAAVPALAIVGFIALWVRIARQRRFRSLAAPSLGGVRPVVRGPTDNFGQAHILTDEKALARYPGPDGLVIGEVLSARPGHGRLVIDPCGGGAGHGMMIAGSRAGKTSSAILQILNWPWSAVVLDPKGEMGEMLKSAIEAQGKRLVLLNPMAEQRIGVDVLKAVDPDKALAAMEVKALVNLIFPDDVNEKKDPYFEQSGKALCAAVMADLISSDRPAHEKNLRTFRKLAVVPEDHMPMMMRTIHAQSRSEFARDLAGSFRKVAPRQWSGIYGQAATGTDWLSVPEYAALVSNDDFEATDLLHGDVVVFIQVPIKALMDSPGIGRVLVGAMMSRVYEAQGSVSGKVLFLLDEASVLQRMAIQKIALVVGAGYGLTLVFFYQSLGQAKEIWGDLGLSTLYNNLAWRGYAAVRDPVTAKELSEEFGAIGVLAHSEGINTGRQRQYGRGFGSRSTGDTTNVTEIRRPLELPQEIQAADPDVLYVIAGQDRMKLRMPVWWRRPELRGIIEPSRFHAQHGTGD